jgi:lysozyme
MFINETVGAALLKGSFNDILSLLEKSVIPTLNQNQVDALCAFIYNVGKGAFLTSSLLSAINHKLLITEDLFTRFNKVTINGKLIVLSGLEARRKKEYQLFMSKDGL